MAAQRDTQLKEAKYKPGQLLENNTMRVEFDSMEQVLVPVDRLWGAQTQRSLIHFSIGSDHMPIEVYHAYGVVKKAACPGQSQDWPASAGKSRCRSEKHGRGDCRQAG